MLPFGVSIRAGEPVSDQVIYAVHKAVVSEQLRPGDPFPSVRTMSKELKINPNTAFKIVAHLKREGLLEVQPGRGTFVSSGYEPAAADKAKLLDKTIEALVVEARKLGLKNADIHKAIDQHWEKL
ncbi:MAG: GntR family transcriptional regulator [Verrucomicrobiota bacterium]